MTAMPTEAKHGRAQSVTWFELFYDLVIVASVSQAGKIFQKSPTWGTTFLIAAGIAILLLTWLMTTLSHGTVVHEIPARRLLVVVQIFAMLIAALSMGKYGLPNYVGMIALVVVFASLAVLYAGHIHWRKAGKLPDGRVALASAIAALAFLLSAWYAYGDNWSDHGWIAPCLLTAIIAIVAIPFLGSYLTNLVKSGLFDSEHMKERLGLLVIIVLGEQFIALVAILGTKGTIPNPVAFGLSLVIAYAIWVLYFACDLPRNPPTRIGGLRAWFGLHALLILGCVSVAAEFAALTLFSEGSSDVGNIAMWTPLPLVAVVLALAGLGWLGGARQSYVRIQLICVALLLILTALDFWWGVDRPWFASTGAVVVIGDALACAIIRASSSRGQVPN